MEQPYFKTCYKSRQHLSDIIKYLWKHLPRRNILNVGLVFIFLQKFSLKVQGFARLLDLRNSLKPNPYYHLPARFPY